jgi:hypothetical protein
VAPNDYESAGDFERGFAPPPEWLDGNPLKCELLHTSNEKFMGGTCQGLPKWQPTRRKLSTFAASASSAYWSAVRSISRTIQQWRKTSLPTIISAVVTDFPPSERAQAYSEAGADMILVHSKQKTPDEIVAFARRWQGETRLVVVPTAYPDLTEARIRELGNICRDQQLGSAPGKE